MSVAWVGAGIAAVGTISQMDAASGAAGAMQGGSDQATQAQMMAAAQMRQDLAPWTEAGGAAQSRLNQLMGLGGVGSSGRTSLGLSTGLTPDQVRQQLMGRYTRQSTAGTGGTAAPTYRSGTEAISALGAQGAHDYFQNQSNAQRNVLTGDGGINSGQPGIGPGYWLDNNDETGQRRWVSTASGDAGGPSSTIDEEGLQAAIDKYYQEQDALNATAEGDPAYGSLMRAYRNGEEFSFTGEDLASDPGYKFGLDQGTQGIERGQAARGNLLSGAAMKELGRFNQDYAGTKFDNAFGRNLTTWNTNLGAYNQNRNSLYDMLTGVSRTGQNSAAQVGTSNISTANNIGSNMIGAGNAAAAGQVAGSNALASGLNGVANAFAQNSGTNGAAAWNSMLAGGPTPYGANPTTVTGGTGWVPTTNVFGGTNGRVF